MPPRAHSGPPHNVPVGTRNSFSHTTARSCFCRGLSYSLPTSAFSSPLPPRLQFYIHTNAVVLSSLPLYPYRQMSSLKLWKPLQLAQQWGRDVKVIHSTRSPCSSTEANCCLHSKVSTGACCTCSANRLISLQGCDTGNL